MSIMIYKNTWNLTGTVEQQTIVKEALDQIHFPWEKLNFPRKPVEIGWMNLNENNMEGELIGAKKHQTGTKGIIDGRRYTLGVFYTHSGKIYIDNLLVKYPSYAKATVSAEIAHAVDYFLPLTDEMKKAIMTLMHKGGVDHHTWWEVLDYGSEYFTLVGEAFMQAFTVAYSDIDFGNTDDFTHSISPDQGPALRAILGIERTDYVAPVLVEEPKPKPPEEVYVPIPEPVKEPEVVEEPVEDIPTVPEEPVVPETPKENKYISLGNSKVYHLLSHYDHWKENLKYASRIELYKSSKEATDAGERPCKVCLKNKS